MSYQEDVNDALEQNKKQNANDEETKEKQNETENNDFERAEEPNDLSKDANEMNKLQNECKETQYALPSNISPQPTKDPLGIQMKTQDFSNTSPKPPQDKSLLKSALVYRKPAMPSEFIYSNDFDENGAIYYIATHGKQAEWKNPHDQKLITVFASSLGCGNLRDIVNQKAVNCRTENEPFSFFGVDLGEGRRLQLTAYSIRNRDIARYMLNKPCDAKLATGRVMR